jgi:hypothetical protein
MDINNLLNDFKNSGERIRKYYGIGEGSTPDFLIEYGE